MSFITDPHPEQSLPLQLPCGLLARIASFLPPGEAAYGLRTVCQAFARELYAPELLTITVGRKRSPVSSIALVSRWGATGSCRGLTYKQRSQLLLDAAQGGSAKAVAQLSRSTGCLPNEDVFRAAARAGNEKVCEWLLGQDIELQDRGAWVLAVAVEAGHMALCQKLHNAGLRLDKHALRLALRAGRRAVFGWMRRQGHVYEASPLELQQADMPDDLPEELWANAAYGGQLELMQELKGDKRAKPEDLPAAAHGCPLAMLRELVEECKHQSPSMEPTVMQRADTMAAAATCPTPDWQDKVLWLLQTGTCSTMNDFDQGAAAAFAALPDAEQRLEWLAGQGFGFQRSRLLLGASVKAGKAELVLQLWSKAKEGLTDNERRLAGSALVEQALLLQGDLGLAMQLQCQGPPVSARAMVLIAACAGRLDVMQWAVQLLREEQAGEAGEAAGVAGGIVAGGGGDGAAGEQQQQQQQEGQGQPQAAGDVEVLDAGQKASNQAQMLQEDADQDAEALDALHVYDLMRPACDSGSLELVQWLLARDVLLGPGAVGQAVDSGNETLVEWMVEQGCDVREVG